MHGSATAIPALALPFSLLGTAAIMAVLGYSLDNLSMMALILSIGFVVDDAIVMLENVVRHMEQGRIGVRRRAHRLEGDRLHQWARRLEAEVARLPELQDVSDDMEMRSPRVNLVID